MKSRWITRTIVFAAVLLAIAGVTYAMWPRPVAVDIAAIDHGPLRVTVDEEGVAEVKEVFRVSAPVAGRISRVPVEVGDTVAANVTDVALIRPTDPSFLDARSRQELQAAADSAKAAVDLAEAQLRSATSTGRLYETDLARAVELSGKGQLSDRALEKARADVDTSKAAIAQAAAALAMRRSELAGAQARLIEPDASTATDDNCLPVKSPVSGTVIRVINEDEQVVAAGTPLVEVGDPANLKLVVPLLSSDAVNVAAGALATIDGWGGPALNATVIRIDPSAHTKVSALGIEEQRVDATLALAEPRANWRSLGHQFHIMAHIVTWNAGDIVRVPLGALFRSKSDWAVYRVVDGKARITPITLGHRNGQYGEVLDGLSAGDQVVLHPSDQVADGVTVATRTEAGE
jgi:HlyD family secretion protein